MVNQVAFAGVAVLAIGGGVAAWFLYGSGPAGLDSAGLALLSDVARERAKDPVDRGACRELLTEFVSHPEHAKSRDMIRGRAWLELLIGRSVKAWDVIEPNLGVEATTADDLVGSKILERRFADSGKEEWAHHGATLARRHFEATGEKGSLFLAWQLQVRRENVDRRGDLATLLVERFPDTVEARLVKVLLKYPDLREEADGALEELRMLEKTFPTIPAELDLAIAWFEVQEAETLRSCVDRVQRVLQRFQSSITARSLGGVVAARLGEWAKAKAWFEALLRHHPNHHARKVWQALLTNADAELAKKKG